MDSTLNFAVDLARQTGQVLKSYFRAAGQETRLKADKSVVTDADMAADRLISGSVRAAYPDDFLLSEELAPRLEADREVAGRAGWIVDPLDGTTNFSLGIHYWGVTIARYSHGQPEAAVLYFPLLEELYTTRRGGGAFLNGDRIQVRPPQPDQPAAFFSCCSRTHRRYQVSVPYKPRILGSASYSLCAVARGVAVLSFEATPKIWDIAGGWLLVQEAGGATGTLDGREPFPISADIDYARHSMPTLAAATPDMLEKARRQIIPREK